VPIILFAIPMFVLFLAVEAVYYRYHPQDDELGYAMQDTVTSLSMGIGSRVWGLLWDIAALLGLTAAYALTPLRIDMHSPWAWVALLVAEDLCYYAFHRASHRVRLFWASHVVHHSSQYYNLSTALRQEWTGLGTFVFWVPLALAGFPVWAIYLQQSISLIYQFFLHTERIHLLPKPIELVMNTPSHHRVHHGVNDQYLDKNYAGIFIVWDRMFGTFEPEVERPRYGITKQLTTFNPFRVGFHEWYVMGHDVRHATRFRDKVGYVLRNPGWQPSSTTATTASAA
jgi:sterol desaturase/sphingolipid hydroxylase (fatty acid hydroxylase superfamily)